MSLWWGPNGSLIESASSLVMTSLTVLPFEMLILCHRALVFFFRAPCRESDFCSLTLHLSSRVMCWRAAAQVTQDHGDTLFTIRLRNLSVKLSSDVTERNTNTNLNRSQDKWSWNFIPSVAMTQNNGFFFDIPLWWVRLKLLFGLEQLYLRFKSSLPRYTNI